jgi:hypothetical protein
LVVTAASVDVVYAIAGFGVASSMLGAGGGGAAEEAWRAPVQLLAGVAGGAILGAMLGVATSTTHETETALEGSGGVQGSTAPAWESPLSRAVAVLGLALAVMFAGAEVRGGKCEVTHHPGSRFACNVFRTTF